MGVLKNYLRSDLKDFNTYPVSCGNYRYRLDANESPFTLDESTKNKFIDMLKYDENFNMYPDTDCIELRNAIVNFWSIRGIDTQNIICATGSDQLIDYITKAFLNKGDLVIAPYPSFSMYKLSTTINHGRFKEIPLQKDELNHTFSYDIKEFIDIAKSENAKIIILCNPNNPTGNIIPLKDIEFLLENVSIPVVIDEAYADFADHTAILLTKKYKNIIVLRTLSKAYGIAGARVGYGIADKEFIEAVATVKPPYNLSALSQKLATYVLNAKDIYDERIQFLIKERKRMMSAISGIKGINAYKSQGNFIYIESIFDLYSKLLEKGILIRKFEGEENLYKMRITIGKEAANTEVIEIIKAGGY